MKQAAGLVVVLLCFLFALAVNAGSGNQEITRGDLVVSVTGNGEVPKYTFWVKGDAGNSYKVMFQQMFEATGDNSSWSKVPASTIALPSLNWEFGPFVNETDEMVEFNITGTLKHKDRFSYLTFRNHLGSDTNCTKNNTICITTPHLKFDVILSDYNWVDPTAYLVLFFKFIPSNNDNANPTQSGLDYHYHGAYFNISDVAHGLLNPNETIKVRTVYRENGVWIIYQHFNGPQGLLHDPIFGAYSTSGDGDDDSNDTIVLIAVLTSVGGVAVIILIAIVIAYVLYKRRGGYEKLLN